MCRVDGEFVRAILREHDLHCGLIRIDRHSDGLENRLFLPETTCDDLVLRLVDDRANDWNIAKEAAVSAHLRTLDVPVRVVCQADVTRRSVPGAYSLLENLTGQPWSRVVPSLTAIDNAGLSGRSGAGLAGRPFRSGDGYLRGNPDRSHFAATAHLRPLIDESNRPPPQRPVSSGRPLWSSVPQWPVT